MTLILEKVSFVAVPKTGTISIESSFGGFAKDFVPHSHDTVDAVKVMSSNPCIATVRHPLSWIESYYKYLRYSPYFAKSGSIWGIHSKTFEQFILAYVRGQKLWPEPKRFQHEYVIGDKNTVEETYRFDNIDKVVNRLSESCGHSVVLPFHNVSPNVELVLSTETRSLFELFAEKDYALYEKAL